MPATNFTLNLPRSLTLKTSRPRRLTSPRSPQHWTRRALGRGSLLCWVNPWPCALCGRNWGKGVQARRRVAVGAARWTGSFQPV